MKHYDRDINWSIKNEAIYTEKQPTLTNTEKYFEKSVYISCINGYEK